MSLIGMQAGVMAGSGAGGLPPATNPTFANVDSLVHYDGTNGSTSFPDVIGGSYTGSGSAAITTARSKWGGASLDLPGSSITSKAITSRAITTSSLYTLEFWVYFVGSGSLVGMCNINVSGSGANSGINIYLNGTSVLCDNGSAGGTGPSFGTITTGQWYHMALVANGTDTRSFQDGILQNTYAGVTGSGTTITQAIHGRYQTGTAMQGGMDDFRWTWGQALYQASFAVPTGPFPNS